MKILYTSDTHVYPAHLKRLIKAAVALNPDVVLIGGDLIPNWKGSIADSIEPHKAWVRDMLLPRLRNFREDNPDIRVILDFGNDDIAAARPLLEEKDGKDLHLLHMRIVRIAEKLAVAGYMKVNPTPFLIKDAEKLDCLDMDGLSASTISEGFITAGGRVTPYRLVPSHGTIEEDLNELSETLQMNEWQHSSFFFISHAPPKATALDAVGLGQNVGSLAVRRFIERWSSAGRLILSLHGHIHESPWKSGRVWQYIGNVPCFNVGQQAEALRALVLNTRDIVGSARLVTVGPGEEVEVHEKNDWI